MDRWPLGVVSQGRLVVEVPKNVGLFYDVWEPWEEPDIEFRVIPQSVPIRRADVGNAPRNKDAVSLCEAPPDRIDMFEDVFQHDNVLRLARVREFLRTSAQHSAFIA